MDYEKNLQLKLFKDSSTLEEILGCKLKVLEMEMNINMIKNRRVDLIYENLSNNKILFCEIQLTESDKRHYEQLRKIIESEKFDNFEILWIANKFEDGYLEQLFDYVISKKKNVRLKAVKISNNFLKKIRKFEIDKLNALKDIDKLLIAKHELKLVKDFNNNANFNNKIADFCDLTNSKHYNYGYLETILEYMRSFSYLESVHTYKNISSTNFRVNLGVSDIFYSMNINEPRNLIYFAINFNSNRYDIFEDILKVKDELDEKTNYMLIYEKNRIYFELPFSKFVKMNLLKFVAYSSILTIEFVFKEIEKKIKKN